MTSGSARHLPVRVQLLVDVVLVALFFALDARDLVFKTKWLGPEDSYSFAATTPTLRLEPKPLVVSPSAADAPPLGAEWDVLSTSVQPPPPQRSGWTSFLQRCKSLHAISPAKQPQQTSPPPFSHVLAKNCQVGRRDAKHVVDELVLSSSVRVDSVAWAACKMLFHHRKPPICHSPIVRLFGHRYNMDDKPSLVTVDHSTGAIHANTSDDAPQGAYSARPGTDAEMEIVELLTVISKSAPLSSAVCVEGFAPTRGAGYYTSTFVACGSPTYNHSAFVGHATPAFQQYHQDKAWLTSDMLHVSGMTYMIRENRRSIFKVAGSTADGTLELEHRTQLNFSCFGALYTIATAADLLLLVVHVYSALEIVKLMLWPLWRSLASPDNGVSRSNAKVAFVADDCQAVLTASLYRSKSIVVLIVLAGTLHWMTVVPSSILLTERGVSDGARAHAALSTFRFWVLVLLALHSLWDTHVAWWERRAYAFVHATYVTVGEVATISGIVGYLRRATILSMPAAKYAAEGQRLADAAAFVGRVAVSNAFPAHHDSLQNTSAPVVALMYAPLLAWVVWSLVAVACWIGARYGYFRLRFPDEHKHHHNSRFFLQCHTSSKSMVKPDLTVEPPSLSDLSPRDDGAVVPPAPPSPTAHHRQGSPKRSVLDGSSPPAVMPASGHEYALRLPLEKVVDVPIRARSLVRNSFKMEKKIGHQIFLRPPQYLEHGIILQGGCLKTRFGFTDIVHPYLRAGNHMMPDDESAHRSSTSGSSSPRRSRSAEKLQHDAHTLRLPLVPLR